MLPPWGLVGRLLCSSRLAALCGISCWRAGGLTYLWVLKMNTWGRPGLHCGSGHLRCWHVRLEKCAQRSGGCEGSTSTQEWDSTQDASPGVNSPGAIHY